MSNCREFIEDSKEGLRVRGFLHQPDVSDGDCMVLTHGAGSNCNAPLLVALADAFCASGVTVLRCDLPFRQLRPQGPPPRGSAERDQQGLRAAVASIRQDSSRMFLGGHSYGGRQASMLAAAEPGLVDQLLLVSYPLHPPERPAELRTAHFPSLQTPAFFVQGRKDGFGSIEEVSAALGLIPARTELLPVTGAGHELVAKKTRDAVVRQIVESFRAFLI